MSNTAPTGAAPLKGAVMIFSGLFLVGAVLSAVALRQVDSPGAWGMLVVNFIFLLSVTQFGVVFSAIMRICGAVWSRPYYRMAEIVTLAFFPFALGMIVIFCLFGSEDLFFWLHPAEGEHLSPWLNLKFLLVRNLVAQLVFYGVAFAYFTGGLIPDMTQAQVDNASGLQRRFFAWVLGKQKGRNIQDVGRATYYWSPMIPVVAIIAQTFIAWDFAMMLTPHFHSTVYPMHFMLGSMFAGTALLLLLAPLAGRVRPGGNFFGTLHIKNIGIMLTAFMCLWLYMFWAQFFVIWYGNLPHETEPLWRQMYGHYGPFFWVMIACVFVLPLTFLIFAGVKRNLWSLGLVALIINLGVWLNRYLMVVPALADDYVPFASLSDWAGALMLFAGFFAAMLALFRALPIVSQWDVEAAPVDQSHG